jgi:hypothetical protein
MKNITFSTQLDIEKEYYPKPASKFIPEWYKNTDSYINGKKEPGGQGGTSATVKKCMPVFDALTAGYIIPSPADIFISERDGQSYYEWSNFGLIQFHPIEQAPLHPVQNGNSYPKWINPWAIKTPPGYSLLFTQPFHRESVFTILPGIVDTDSYSAQVNFPFTLNDPKFEGVIPAGTPLAQVIPIKREVWQMQYGDAGQDRVNNRMHTKIFDRYKTLFWNKKEYR